MTKLLFVVLIVVLIVVVYLWLILKIARANHLGLDDMPRRPVQKLPPAKVVRLKDARGLSRSQQHEIYRRAAAQSRKE